MVLRSQNSFFCLTFAVTMTMILFLHQSAKKQILYAPVQGTTFFGQLSSEQRAEGQRISDRDREIMEEVGMSSTATYDDVASRWSVKQEHNGIGSKDTMVADVNRILAKIKAYHAEYVKCVGAACVPVGGLGGVPISAVAALFSAKDPLYGHAA
ncbi:hypothetical protein VQ056_11020 [Paenibacillus sp. JTLBN-2024]